MKGKGPRSFDPVVIGHMETECWAGYYRHEWARVLRAAVGMVAEGFGMGRRRTIAGAWHVLRANQAWAPYPDNDPAAAKRHMQRFYQLVADDGGLTLDPSHAATLELQWWRLHRAHQHDASVTTEQLIQSLVELYSYLYAIDPTEAFSAARWRVEAMDLSDRWVEAGCRREDQLLAAERRALVDSYTALLAAVSR